MSNYNEELWHTLDVGNMFLGFKKFTITQSKE